MKKESPVVFKDLMGWMRSEMATAIKAIKEANIPAAGTVPIPSPMVPPSHPSTSSSDVTVTPQPPPGQDSAVNLQKRKRGEDSGDSELSEGEVDISSLEEIPSGEELDTDKPHKFAFATDALKLFLKAMRDTMGIKTEEKTLSPLDHMYESLSDPEVVFIPVHSSLKNMIKREWDNPERRAFWPKSLANKYPFDPNDQKFWGPSPKLDPALSKVSRKSDLQFEDFGNLKDPIDKKMDNLLRRAWESSSLTFKPAVASTAAARSLKLWLSHTQSQIASGVPREEILKDFDNLFHAANYLSDAADDTVRLSARTTALVNSTRRGIWVKTWQGDTSSKSKLCGIPCEGELLFGSKLDETLERSSDNKKNFPIKRKNFRFKRSFRDPKQSEQGSKSYPKRRWGQNKPQRPRPNVSFPLPSQGSKQ
ncbi:lamina-associated polypeptide 2, isoforms alpha/zeta-like [Hyperolius riggenbachi]